MKEALKELMLRMELEKRVKKLLSDCDQDPTDKISESFCNSHV
jgi:hypothetical protein